MSADAHVSLWIDGTPAPQGSKTGVRRGDRVVLIEGGSATGRRKHRAWRDACTTAALPHRRDCRAKARAGRGTDAADEGCRDARVGSLPPREGQEEEELGEGECHAAGD